jgi:hypothetical protein
MPEHTKQDNYVLDNSTADRLAQTWNSLPYEEQQKRLQYIK